MKIKHAINEEVNVYFHYIDCGFKKLIEKKWAIYGKFRLYIKQYYCIAQSSKFRNNTESKKVAKPNKGRLICRLILCLTKVCS